MLDNYAYIVFLEHHLSTIKAETNKPGNGPSLCPAQSLQKSSFFFAISLIVPNKELSAHKTAFHQVENIYESEGKLAHCRKRP